MKKSFSILLVLFLLVGACAQASGIETREKIKNMPVSWGEMPVKKIVPVCDKPVESSQGQNKVLDKQLEVVEFNVTINIVANDTTRNSVAAEPKPQELMPAPYPAPVLQEIPMGPMPVPRQVWGFIEKIPFGLVIHG